MGCKADDLKKMIILSLITIKFCRLINYHDVYKPWKFHEALSSHTQNMARNIKEACPVLNCIGVRQSDSMSAAGGRHASQIVSLLHCLCSVPIFIF